MWTTRASGKWVEVIFFYLFQHFLFKYLKKINLIWFFCSSSKIREEDYRQIQTNVPFLAPEILAVFANSQIFHDSQPTKSLAIVHKSPSIHEDLKKHTRNDSDSEKKLLKRLEGNNFDWIQIKKKKNFITKMFDTVTTRECCSTKFNSKCHKRYHEHTNSTRKEIIM